MISRFKRVIFILLLPLFLTGCWDNLDVNKKSIVLSIGVDNVDDNIEFTGEIAKLTSSSSKSKGAAQVSDEYNFISKGKTFEEARTDYDCKIPTTDFSGAMRVVVFSNKYAKSGIESYINRIYFLMGFRNSLLIAVSKEPTAELFNGKIQNDISAGYAIEDTIRYLNQNGEALYKTVLEIKSDIQLKDVGYLLPYVTKKENIIKYLGIAVMKDSKLVGIINKEDSNGFLFILSKKPFIESVIENPTDKNNLISIKTTLEKRSIKTSYENKKINIYIDLKLNGQLQYQYNIKPISDEDMKKIEEMNSNKIKEDIISAINRSQNEFQCDVFGFARYFRADNPEDYKVIRWKEEYPKAVFHVNIETTIKNTNLLDTNAKKKY